MDRDKSLRTIELDRVLEMLSGHAVSEEAKARSLALRPAQGAGEAQRLQDETSAARELVGVHGSPPFSGVRDVSLSLRRADMGGTLSMRELLHIGALLTCTRRARDYASGERKKKTCIDHLFASLRPNKYFEEKIAQSILSEDEVADGASAELSAIRRSMRAANSKIREVLQKIITSQAYSKYLQDTIITTRSGRFVVPVKSEHRGDFSGLVHDVSSSGATVFMEPTQVVQLNNELREHEAKEKAEIERILSALSAEAVSFAEDIMWNFEALCSLDLIFARGKLSYALNAMSPEIRDGGGLEFIRARHPLLDPKTAVPITVRLGTDFDTLVITGPNTGGKTVTLKTIGLLTVMALCGLHIPCDTGSFVSVYDSVFADIGDEQSIEQSLSTFSSHMRNIVSIVELAGERSLVLFDELGAGTDPVEGAALAVAVIQHVRSLGANIVATTHYAELKSFALTTAGVENASCEFDVETLRPTYRLLIGVPGKSNAFAISKRLGLPEKLVENAKALVGVESSKFEDVLSSLEGQRQAMENERLRAKILRQEAENAAKKAEKDREFIEKERNKAVERARDEARYIIEQAREKADAVFRELDEMRKAQKKAGFQEINEQRAELRRMLNEAEGAMGGADDEEAPAPPPRPLRPGDTVEILKMKTRATVLTHQDSSGNVQLQAGIMKVTANVSGLRLTDADAAVRAEKYAAGVARELREPSGGMELDLRGRDVSDALTELQHFIDGAVMSGLLSVRIIHGKGTGALRSAVQSELRAMKHVKAFRLGRYGEGDNGVTIAELRQ